MSDQVWDRSGTGLDTSSQLGTFLGESGRPGTLSRAVQLWTDKGGFADVGKQSAVTGKSMPAMEVTATTHSDALLNTKGDGLLRL